MASHCHLIRIFFALNRLTGTCDKIFVSILQTSAKPTLTFCFFFCHLFVAYARAELEGKY